MITHDQELKIQAHLDGELPDSERAALENLLAKDPEARALLEELSQTHGALHANEPVRLLPESREFHWSKISRAIQREEAAASARPKPVRSWWFRIAASLAGCSALAIVLFSVSRQGVSSLPSAGGLPSAGAIESVLDDTPTITFRSEAEGLTVVWVTSN